jgi:hypothetical protein
MVSKVSLSAVVTDWIAQVTRGGTADIGRGEAAAAPPELDEAMELLAAFAGAWPDQAAAEEAREIVDDLQAVMPRLRAVSNRSPVELMAMSSSKAPGDIAAAAAIHDLAAKAIADLSRRVTSGIPGDPPLPTEVAELRLLQSGIRARIEPTEESEALYADDRKAYAEALLLQVDSAGTIRQHARTDDVGRWIPKSFEERQAEIDGLTADFEDYVARLVADDSQVLLAAAIRAIDDLAPARDKPAEARTAIERMAVQLSARLGDTVTRALSQTPQLERTYTERTPNDILMHLMATVRALARSHPDNRDLQSLGREGRAMFMTHTADSVSVRTFLGKAKPVLGAVDADALATVGTLETQLPPLETVEQQTRPRLQARTQLHDNIYGRVFETKFIAALVEQPPEEFLDICAEVGQAFSDLLDDEDEACVAAAVKVGLMYSAETPRPWSRGVPEMPELAETAKEEKAETGYAGDTLDAIKSILVTPPQTGQEMVARLSLMAEFSDWLTRERRKLGESDPAWMKSANPKYADFIKPQRTREMAWPDDDAPATDAVGITLLHQPAAARDVAPSDSTRASTYYRFGKRDGETELEDIKIPPVIQTAHEKGIPFASGVSGTANMLLHLFWHLRKEGGISDEIPPSFFLMMTAILPGYNGGHSIHEVLWVGNLLDRDLGLDLNLGDPDDPNGFVSDYDALLTKFDGDVADKVNQAADAAWDGTQDYLEQHSVFATGPLPPGLTETKS